MIDEGWFPYDHKLPKLLPATNTRGIYNGNIAHWYYNNCITAASEIRNSLTIPILPASQAGQLVNENKHHRQTKNGAYVYASSCVAKTSVMCLKVII